MASGRIGSSTQYGANGATARQMVVAAPRFHNPCSSTISWIDGNGLADGLEHRQPPIEVGSKDRRSAGALRGGVEGPDLHAGQALRGELPRERRRLLEEGPQVVVAGVLQAPVARVLARRAADVAGTSAGVVDGHALAHRAAEQIDDRQPGSPAEQIPEREVDGPDRSRLHAPALEADVRRQQRRHPFRRGVGEPEQHRRNLVVQVGLDRAGGEERLAQRLVSIGASQPKQRDVGLEGRPDRLELDDRRGR